MKARENMII